MSEAVMNRFRSLTQWTKNGQRAPHKPLMLLIALGRFQNGVKEFSYEQIESDLIDLLVKYGPQRAKYKPEEPFWRLGRSEKIFNLKNATECRVHRDGGTNRSDLIKYSVMASFDADIQLFLQTSPQMVSDIAIELINQHFQPTFVEDLMDEVGLSVLTEGKLAGRRRDPDFRRKVLSAYKDQCAVCRFHLLLNRKAVGLEAAHIKWHNAGGPDTEDNGLALCTLHHKLFDYGVFLIEAETYKIKVSDSVSCFNSAGDFVSAFHNERIHLPLNHIFYPDAGYLKWHEREIFKGNPDY